MSEPSELVLLSRASDCLQKANTVDEIQDLRDKAQAASAYAKKAKLGASIVVAASALKIQAERKLGELLQQLPLAKGGQGNQHRKGDPNRLQHTNGSVTLRELGVTPWDSSRSQKIASLPREKFENYLRSSVESAREPTTSALLRLAKQHDAIERTKAQPNRMGVVKDLRHLVRREAKFGCIYADPPWPYRNRTSRGASENHYPSMTMKDILAEPVSKLAHEKSHLHLWCSVSFLKEALDVIAAWGFVYKSQFIWVKPQMGAGNYYRISHEVLLYGERPQQVDHEVLLLGQRGGELFLSNSVKSWAEFPRGKHSEKPNEVREMVSNVSPGPYLEMYGRKRRNGWTVYGNQVE